LRVMHVSLSVTVEKTFDLGMNHPAREIHS
jgi:hypothetical protein